MCCGNIPVTIVRNCSFTLTLSVSFPLLLFRLLIKCLVDSGEMEEAASFAKHAEEFMKSHIPHLYPRLFTLLVNGIIFIL